MSLKEIIFRAGIVGAGGAGFPTHIKASSKVDFVVANGAECEPLLHKDFEISKHFAKEIIAGMNLMIAETSAQKGYFGMKSKNQEAIDEVEKYIKNTNIELTELEDYYPAGDEYELVYETTKRLIPAHGIPLDVGIVVNNVETLYNISQAEKGITLTEKFVCVTGIVKNPSTFFVPIGTTFRQLLDFVGGTTSREFVFFVGGIMMGKLSDNLDEVVTKTTAGLIFLPAEHYLANRMQRTTADMNRIGKSACDQCSYCTEFCPRYLMGYDVQPHKVMRSLGFSTSGNAIWDEYADLCSTCGLCSLYSCPEDLYPREACVQGKEYLRNEKIKHVQPKEVKIHPMKNGRKVPLKQLMNKLNVRHLNYETPFQNNFPIPKEVKILMKQHFGISAKPIVVIGQKVEKGELIGKIDENQLGALIHSSIEGIVTHVSNEFVRIKSE